MAIRKKLLKPYLQKQALNYGIKLLKFLQYKGTGFVDLLLANRPIIKTMLKDSVTSTQLSIKVLEPHALIGLKIQAYKNDPVRELRVF